MKNKENKENKQINVHDECDNIKLEEKEEQEYLFWSSMDLEQEYADYCEYLDSKRKELD